MANASVQEGNVEINSDEVMTAVGILDESLSSLQSTMQPSISSDFTALVDTGLFSEGISMITKQIQSLCTSNENLMSKMTIHAEEFAELEASLALVADNFSSGYNNYSGGRSGNYSAIADAIVASVSKGNAINDETILSSITKLEDSEQTKLVEFLKLNKEGGTTLEQLLLDPAKAGVLLTLLKKFYGDTTTTESELSANAYAAQKALLEKLSAGDLMALGISNTSILTAKSYLSKVAKENNITLSELLLNDSNSNILLKSLTNVYDGNGLDKYDLTSSEVESIRSLIDNVAKKENVSAETVISDVKYLSALKEI